MSNIVHCVIKKNDDFFFIFVAWRQWLVNDTGTMGLSISYFIEAAKNHQLQICSKAYSEVGQGLYSDWILMPVQGFVLDPYLPETERFVLVFVFILFT